VNGKERQLTVVGDDTQERENEVYCTMHEALEMLAPDARVRVFNRIGDEFNMFPKDAA
jgi:hypothetical protein